MAQRNEIEAPQTTLPIHLKYRPKELRDVFGQDAIVKSIRAALAMRARPHCYLFTGPAGTGKTTLGRIVAGACGVGSSGMVEVDGASNNGVDDMRKLTEGLIYQGFGDEPNKAIFINECQRLSAQAWDALLTTTEEPPPHVYFMFTSTNPAKIPSAMVTRCQVYNLKPLRRDDVIDALERVVDAERFDTKGKVLGMIADACGGSMRAALTMLANVHALEDLDAVGAMLEHPLEDAEVIDLCRLLVGGKLTWSRLVEVLQRLGDTVSPETIRIVTCAYLTKCILGARNERDAKELLFMLRQFAEPFDAATKLAPVLLAFGRILYG